MENQYILQQEFLEAIEDYIILEFEDENFDFNYADYGFDDEE